ncbi:MAG: PEP-CTERM sorting domain-containing protein [Planctomycetaceae bacterium]|nr:PEP-CTERM sorting domain-containing protein [Planctomycetaceae bacterium]
MKKLLLVASALVLATAAESKADFVLDDFAIAQTVQTLPVTGGTVTTAPGVDRTITTPPLPAPFTTISTGGGNFNATGTAIGSVFTMTYDFATPFDLHSTGSGLAANPLVLDLFDTVEGAWELVATYTSSTAGASASFAPIAITAPTVIGLDGRDLGNGLLASTVDSVDLVFTATAIGGGGVATFGNTAASIAAVPEPASIALLGLTGLCGTVIVRRRKAKKEIA